MDDNSKGQLSPGMRIYMTKVFPVLLVLAGAWLLYYGGRILLRADQSKTWPATEGVIKDSSVVPHGKSYGAKVMYDYTVSEKSFSGRRIAFGSYNTSRSDAQKIVDGYPKGKIVSVYYDPNNPQACVLEAGIKGQAWVRPGIGLFMAAAGILLAIFYPMILKRHSTVEQGTLGDHD